MKICLLHCSIEVMFVACRLHGYIEWGSWGGRIEYMLGGGSVEQDGE